MQVKTQEAQGVVLDWAVACALAKAEERPLDLARWVHAYEQCGDGQYDGDWALTGPIIRKYSISFQETQSRTGNGSLVQTWDASFRPVFRYQNYESRMAAVVAKGRDHTTAALRAVVTHHLGLHLDVPEEVVGLAARVQESEADIHRGQRPAGG